MEIRSSGIDWFELDGGVDFDGKMVALPKLLEALSRGEQVVRLDDGSLGILPSEWLAKYCAAGWDGRGSGDVLKFGKTQIGFLDALLATMPEATMRRDISTACGRSCEHSSRSSRSTRRKVLAARFGRISATASAG